MTHWEIIYYETSMGACPVEKYLDDDISAKEAERVAEDINLLAEFGTRLGMPKVRFLESAIWELRS